MNRGARFAAGLLALLTLVAADDTAPVPKFGPANTAVEKRDAAFKKAATACAAAETVADRQLIKELDIAANQAMAAKNLDAANEVASLKKAAEARITARAGAAQAAAATPGANAVTAKFHVRWTDTDNHFTLANGKARNTSNSSVGAVSVDKGNVIIHWDNGWIDRITAVGNGIVLVESWDHDHAHSYPDSLPTRYARGDSEN